MESTTVCQGLLSDLQDREPCTDRSLLVIIDGAKALEPAVRQTPGQAAVLHRCQVHTSRNILKHYPERHPVGQGHPHARLHELAVKTAKRLLQGLPRRLEADYPSASASAREGLDQTLTILS